MPLPIERATRVKLGILSISSSSGGSAARDIAEPRTCKRALAWGTLTPGFSRPIEPQKCEKRSSKKSAWALKRQKD